MSEKDLAFVIIEKLKAENARLREELESAPDPLVLDACKNLLWHLCPDSMYGHATLRAEDLRSFAETAIQMATHA